MIIGVLKEQQPEKRVSLVPEVVAALVKMNVQVSVENGAGEAAYHTDKAYTDAGATLKGRDAVAAEADILLSIHSDNIPASIKKDAVVIGVFQPLFDTQKMQDFAGKGYTVFSMDTIPRTTRAQAMDVLSSQANIAGYKAVLLAAMEYCRYFPMFMTAAGMKTH